MADDRHEFDLIARIRRNATRNDSVVVGIGDDAAQLRVGKDRELLVAKDVLMEGVHFDLSVATPREVGRKALAVNLSDLAAMAGRPTSALVGLVLPGSRGMNFAEELMAGLMELADEFGVAIAGGDTNIWNGPAVVSVTVIGEPTVRKAVLRSSGRPGDWLMVTGRLGGSLSGRHLNFTPRVAEAARLHSLVDLHAMIDLSDGLASDVQHLLVGGLGAIIEAEAVPIHPDVAPSLPPERRLAHALSDGEDFELLLAVDPTDGKTLLDSLPFETPLTRIGELTAEGDCWLQPAEGEPVRLKPTGWEHRFDEGSQP